ncbi:Uncharacterized protein HZ326_13564 [Fusarium oxysporum f. sp. albedinis]|nr:Uncharacterized protein HZ326_13564 [Fusarium oxysporum f. sp. albedinis]
MLVQPFNFASPCKAHQFDPHANNLTVKRYRFVSPGNHCSTPTNFHQEKISMAPALRMTRSIKEKLPIFLCFFSLQLHLDHDASALVGPCLQSARITIFGMSR